MTFTTHLIWMITKIKAIIYLSHMVIPQ